MHHHERKEIVCPSGAVLKIGLAPFAVSKALYQVILKELKDFKLESSQEMAQLWKDIFCLGFSSEAIDKALWACLSYCTYNDGHLGELKVTEATFEPLKARDDYMLVSIEVGKENIFPFVKSLYAEYKKASEMLDSMFESPEA